MHLNLVESNKTYKGRISLKELCNFFGIPEKEQKNIKFLHIGQGNGSLGLNILPPYNESDLDILVEFNCKD